MIGEGARVLVERAVGGRGDVDRRCWPDFRAAYRARPIVETRLYAGHRRQPSTALTDAWPDLRAWCRTSPTT
jgi:hypothetical protein